MLYKKIQAVWHYFKCVIFLKSEIGIRAKRKFCEFGNESVINKPYLQLSGCKNIVVGNNTTILNNCRLAVYGEGKKPSIVIGNNCYIGFGFSALASSKGHIYIGNDVLFASNVLITNENHGMNPESNIPYMNQELNAKNISIGNGCWIGENVCILPGVNIGEKSIIGAGAVVTKEIPPFSIAVGNPAKIIKQYSFEEKKWKSV